MLRTPSQPYDVAIIGAGLSGLAAGIRLAHFGKRVCIFERHNAAGGLNGFYSLGGRKYDVGLHAVTNFVPPGAKGAPLAKIFRQLRIDREEFALCPQRGSRVAFGPRGERQLRFSNDFGLLESQVAAQFPGQIDGFRRIAALVRDAPLAGTGAGGSARAALRESIDDPVLEDMLLCPLMFYGSAREDDMDLSQFSIMFRALFLEGFARPLDGVRVIMRVLLAKYRAAGGERRMKCGVRRIVEREGRAAALILDSGEEVEAGQILSSIGAAETGALMGDPPKAGRTLGYVETISVLNRPPAAFGWGDDTIVFFNDSDRFEYREPGGQVDLRSGIICFPNNFEYGPGRGLPRGCSASRAWRTTVHGPTLRPRPTKPTSGAGSAGSRSRRCGFFRETRSPARSPGRRWRPTCSRPRPSKNTPGTFAGRSTGRPRSTRTDGPGFRTCFSAERTRGCSESSARC
jgi:phytoene dehydrogenase-like protein